MSTPLLALTAVVIALVMLVAALLDLRSRRIPNWLTVPFLFVGFAFQIVWQGWEGLTFALVGFATGFGVLFVLWLIGGGGGGDVKLMAALGAWLGPKLILITFLLSAVLVLLAAVATWVVRGAGTLAARPDEPRKKRPRQRVPYAVPLALATWLVLGCIAYSSQAVKLRTGASPGQPDGYPSSADGALQLGKGD